MTRLPVMAIAALTLISSPVLSTMLTTPAFAQSDAWGSSEPDLGDGSVRDLVRSWIEDRSDRRAMLSDLIQDRRERRDDLRDLLQERMDRRGELMDLLRDHPGLRDRLRERLASRWGDETSQTGDENDDRAGWRDRLRGRLAARSGQGCFFLTRSLRDEDGSLLVVVRRRICRD